MSIYIPKKIKVGYQDRSDTYTGKLAYVIYYDEKNKLRKEKSWNGWRDNTIDPNDFDNEPTRGFVLNKKVGDYGGSWANTDMHIVEFTIQEDLSLRLQLKICFSFWNMRIA